MFHTRVLNVVQSRQNVRLWSETHFLPELRPNLFLIQPKIIICSLSQYMARPCRSWYVKLLTITSPSIKPNPILDIQNLGTYYENKDTTITILKKQAQVRKISSLGEQRFKNFSSPLKITLSHTLIEKLSLRAENEMKWVRVGVFIRVDSRG